MTSKATLAPEVLPQPNELPVIKFHKEFLGPILSGDKVSTIRIRPLPFKIDGEILAEFLGVTTGVRYVKIVIVDLGVKRFKDLTSEDAYYEGYNKLDDLKEALKSIYPSLRPRDKVYYYRFKLVE